MPVCFRQDRGCGVLELRGSYTIDEARRALLRGLQDLSTARAAGLVVDVSDSEVVRGKTSTDIMRAAQGLGMLGDRFSHRLGVVASPPLTYGMMRMGGIHAEEAGLTVHVCRSYESAVAWVLRGGPIDDSG